MKIKKETEGTKIKFTFVCENEEEILLMGGLREHFFWGIPENKTYPEYDGVTFKDRFVTSLSLRYNKFKDNT